LPVVWQAAQVSPRPERRAGGLQPMIGALQRLVAGGMAVHATRVGEQFSDLRKDGARTLRSIGDALECRGGLEEFLARRYLRRAPRHRGENAEKDQRCDPHGGPSDDRKGIARIDNGSEALESILA
jgi:hypothetical protein